MATLQEIQDSVKEQLADACVVPLDKRREWSVMALNEEAGEVAGRVVRDIYKDRGVDLTRYEDELGDVLWDLMAVINSFGLSAETIWQKNVDKLTARYAEGVQKYEEAHKQSEDR